MSDRVSPEEKLLRLIRGQKKSQPAVAGPIEGITPKVKLVQQKPADVFSKFTKSLTPRKVIAAVFVLSCILLLVNFIYPFIGLREIKLPEVKQSGAQKEPQPRVEIKPFEYYLEGVQGKQIFANAGSAAGQAGPVNLSLDLMKDLNLLGVITGENPQAIIEDKKAQKTYYVNKGQFIGELQVTDIQEGKVILTYNGQNFEMHL